MTRQIKFIPPIQVSSATPLPITITGTVKPVKNPVILNPVTDPVPGTETSFSTGVIKRFYIENRGGFLVKISYVMGQSGTIFKSILPTGGFYSEDGLDDVTITFYMQSAGASQRLEVTTWS